MPYGDFDTNGYKNPASVIELAAQVARIERDGLTITLIDDEIYTIGDPGADGVYAVQFDQYVGIFAHNGTTTILINLDGGTQFDDADTDTKMCLYLSGSDLLLRNRIGATHTIKVVRLA